MNNNTIKLTTLKDKMGWGNLDLLDPVNGYIDSFKVYDKKEGDYIEPFLSVREGNLNTVPHLVLISAAGAVGKSQMTKYLSLTAGVPVLDLALHEEVGGYSLMGLLSEQYDPGEIKRRLSDGRQAIIIDALDEGLMKVTHDAFFKFIDDITRYVNKNGGITTPFILLGRSGIMELVTLYLEEKGYSAPLLRIEPFTEDQAKEFIDVKVIGDDKSKYTQAYKEVIDYLITNIRGFFKSQGLFDRATYENFIGYAPVLDAIVRLLKNNSNYQKLIGTLKDDGKTNIDLLVQLIEFILCREKEKLQNGVTDALLVNYRKEDREAIDMEVYSPMDQCVRLLSISMNEEYSPVYNGDEAFSYAFEKQAHDMFGEHPFLHGRRINNVVFESYVLAMAASSDKHSEKALRYIRNRSLFKNSFAFYPLFMAMVNKERTTISDEFFPPLYESLSSQSSSMIQTRVEIVQDETHPEIINVELENVEHGTYDELTMELHDENEFNPGKSIGNLILQGDFDVSLSGQQVSFNAPMDIECRKFRTSCSELSLVRTIDRSSDVENANFSITCHSIELSPSAEGVMTRLIRNGCDLKILSNVKPGYPFADYHVGEPMCNDDPDYLKFQKLRRILRQFRGHKKGELAKKKDKIKNRNPYGVGADTVKALEKTGIIYGRGHLYVIDEQKFRDELSITYDEMVNGKINEKVRAFLASY